MFVPQLPTLRLELSIFAKAKAKLEQEYPDWLCLLLKNLDTPQKDVMHHQSETSVSINTLSTSCAITLGCAILLTVV